VSRLARHLEISVPAVAQHLKVLEWSGLVRTAKFGRARSCRLDPEAFRPVERWIRTCRTGWNRRFERYLPRSASEKTG
jgi:predicted ArsR family transcriptional regulator